jgi:hypothetical protein
VRTETPNRRVHACGERVEIVRYDQAGKWYEEAARDSEPKERAQIGVREAAEHALRIRAKGGRIYLGLPGGSTFDRIVSGDA